MLLLYVNRIDHLFPKEAVGGSNPSKSAAGEWNGIPCWAHNPVIASSTLALRNIVGTQWPEDSSHKAAQVGSTPSPTTGVSFSGESTPFTRETRRVRFPRRQHGPQITWW